MQDFMGNPLQVGDYVAAGGAGNRAAEYGMILYRVLEVAPKLKLVRLTDRYPTHDSNFTEIKASKVITVQNPNKYVRVQPSSTVRDLFDRGVEGKLTQAEANLLGRWIHGADHQTGLFP
jgi:hypothetical protein